MEPTFSTYELYYWPFIQGRGEFVRLVLEEAATPYVDVARVSEEDGGGMVRMLELLRGEGDGVAPYAPPLLKAGDLVIAQSANICRYLGERHGLAPDDDTGRWQAAQLQMTVADFVDEAHNTHHPVSGALYYEDQKVEALKAAGYFVAERLPKYLDYFARVLSASRGPWLFGEQLSYVDLSIFQIVAGIEFALPRASARALKAVPPITELAGRVAARPNTAAYLASERRIPFNDMGIFRHYPELDSPPSQG